MMYLTSSVASVAEHLHKNYLTEFEYKTILFIDTAAEDEIDLKPCEEDWLIKDLESLQDLGYQVDRFSVTGKKYEDIEKNFSEYDVLYMCGGDTKYLIEKLHKSGSFELIKSYIKEGKPYISTSAGSILVGPILPGYYCEENEVIKCLDLVSFSIVPHWGSKDFEKQWKKGNRLDQVYSTEQDPLLILTDMQYVVVDDQNKMTIVRT